MKKYISTLTLLGLSTLAPSTEAFVRGKELSILPTGFVHYKVGFYYCSGTQISDRVILTAAHCAAKIDEGDRMKLVSHSQYMKEFQEDAEYRKLEQTIRTARATRDDLGMALANNEISEEDYVSQFTAICKTIDALFEKQYAMRVGGPYKGNVVKAIFAHPNSAVTTATYSNLRFDLALVVLEESIPAVGIAKIDTSYTPKRNADYLTLGHNKRTSSTSGKYNYDLLNRIKLDKQFGYYSFGTRLSKGKTTEGDSGGPLYRKNPRTGKYDTVIGTVMGGTRFLGFADKELIYAPLNSIDSSTTERWIAEDLKKAKAVR